jgi:hypothetical protein
VGDHTMEKITINDSKFTFKVTGEGAMTEKVLHSFNDAPSCETDEVSEWHSNGVYHRENGPARVAKGGTALKTFRKGLVKFTVTSEWYTNGVLKRWEGYSSFIVDMGSWYGLSIRYEMLDGVWHVKTGNGKTYITDKAD